MSEFNLSPQWRARAAQVAQLFAAVPADRCAPVFSMLSAGQAQYAVLVAAANEQREAVVLDSAATQSAVQQIIAQLRPAIVVCHTDVFGWVSKLAFLHGVTAVYTCASSNASNTTSTGAEEVAGTLLDRASHFDAATRAIALKLPRLHCFGPNGEVTAA